MKDADVDRTWLVVTTPNGTFWLEHNLPGEWTARLATLPADVVPPGRYEPALTRRQALDRDAVLERLLRAAQEIRLDFATMRPEDQAKWIHLPEFRTAIDATLKREPSAAPQAGQEVNAASSPSSEGHAAGPAAAAPDVAEMVKRLREVDAELKADGCWSVHYDTPEGKLWGEAAALLARLGQGWKVTETWRGPMGTCPRCGADHYCKPTPGASDE